MVAMVKPKILIVDDLEESLDILAQVLRRQGCEIRFVPTAAAALELIQRENFDRLVWLNGGQGREQAPPPQGYG